MRIKYLFLYVFVLFVSVMLAMPSYAKIDQNNIVGFWSFNDAGGKTVKDSSKNKFDGNVVGSPKAVDGKAGKALEFNGTTDYIDVTAINTPQVMTFACWFKKLGAGSGGVPRLHTRGTGPWALEFGVGNTAIAKQLGFYLAFADGSATGWTGFFEPKEGTWYHTAISYDGTNVKGYIDGKEVVSNKSWAGKKLNQGISRIGGGAASDAFNGDIDEAMIFDVALSEADIASLMNPNWMAVSSLDKIAATWGNIKNK
ncbi:MAG: LamG domain-containing protein [Candidatus Poribacteria bacterium]